MSWSKDRYERILRWQSENEFVNFIDDDQIEQILKQTQNPSSQEVTRVIKQARQNASKGQMLSVQDTAILLNNKNKLLWDEIYESANHIKEEVYGNRIVLFSPLYLSSSCVNACKYCGFSSTNKTVKKHSLSQEELRREIHALLECGQKRLIAVFGEHEQSDHNYIAAMVKEIYGVKNAHSQIRRANVNAAPMFEDEYKVIKDAGIGTFQIFQETYHKQTYAKFHPKGTLKGEYDWRLFGLHRALKAGLDDVGIGALFGLYDYKFEVISLLLHSMELERVFGVGAHTISFPRIKRISQERSKEFPYAISDDELMQIAAVIRLMCPFTGTILTAREEPKLRDIMLKRCGISQTDAGTNIGVGGYFGKKQENNLQNQQFEIGDHRGIDEFILYLLKEGKLPSFCTSCYREGRTGCSFMPLAKNAKIKYLCIPNAILSFKEYLRDYASNEVKEIGEKEVIPKYLDMLRQNLPNVAKNVENMMIEVDNGKSDCHI